MTRKTIIEYIAVKIKKRLPYLDSLFFVSKISIIKTHCSQHSDSINHRWKDCQIVKYNNDW